MTAKQNRIILFKTNRAEALACFHRYLRSECWFLPTNFVPTNVSQQSFYVPVVHLTALVDIHYGGVFTEKVKTIKKDSDGKETTTFTIDTKPIPPSTYTKVIKHLVHNAFERDNDALPANFVEVKSDWTPFDIEKDSVPNAVPSVPPPDYDDDNNNQNNSIICLRSNYDGSNILHSFNVLQEIKEKARSECVKHLKELLRAEQVRESISRNDIISVEYFACDVPIHTITYEYLGERYLVLVDGSGSGSCVGTYPKDRKRMLWTIGSSVALLLLIAGVFKLLK